MPYAADTEVPVERSKSHIEGMLRVRGAQGFASAWDNHGDQIEFMWNGLRIRFHLPKMPREKFELNAAGRKLPDSAVDKKLQQHDRSRWRALYLVVKAKLEAVDAGISILEEEFLAFIVDPESNRTVGDTLVPRIMAKNPLLLTDGKRK